jgi:hypothetical protein
MQTLDLVAIETGEQRIAAVEMTVERADADTRPLGHGGKRKLSPPFQDEGGGGIQQLFPIALGIGAAATQDFLLKFFLFQPLGNRS